MYIASGCPRCRIGVITSLSCPSCGLVRTRDGRELTLASPGRRLLGYIVESFLLWGLVFFGFLFAGIGAAAASDTGRPEWVLIGLILMLALFVGYIVWWFMLAGTGETPIKRMLGMRVVNTDGTPASLGTMLIRTVVGKWALAMFTFWFYATVDSLWLLWDKDRQCLHDKMGKTLVVRTDAGYVAQGQILPAEQAFAIGADRAFAELPAGRPAWDGQPLQQQPAYSPMPRANGDARGQRPAPAAPNAWPQQPVQRSPMPDWGAQQPQRPAPNPPVAAGGRPRPQPSGSPAEMLARLERDYAARRVTEEQYAYWKARLGGPGGRPAGRR